MPGVGVWEVENVLDAKYDANASEFSPRIVSIEVRDVPGVLNQVTGRFQSIWFANIMLVMWTWRRSTSFPVSARDS